MKKGIMYRIFSLIYKWKAITHLNAFPVNKSVNDSTTTACFVYSNLEKLKPLKYKDYKGEWLDNVFFQVGDTDYYVCFYYDWLYQLHYTKTFSNIGKCYNIGGCSLKSKKESSFAIELSKRIQDWYIEKYGEMD